MSTHRNHETKYIQVISYHLLSISLHLLHYYIISLSPKQGKDMSLSYIDPVERLCTPMSPHHNPETKHTPYIISLPPMQDMINIKINK